VFYGFPLDLSDAVRILKKGGYLENGTFPPNVMDKEAYLESYIALLFPPIVDHLIEITHETFKLPKENIVPTFFADTVCNDEEIMLFAIGDSWRNKLLIAPTIIARLARFLGKDLKKEDLPGYYLAANDDGIWRKEGDPFFLRRVTETINGIRTVAIE
jgi:hypothetical protein